MSTLIGDASNLSLGSNPPYELSDFYTMYPQFSKDDSGNQAVPEVVIQMYINLATTCVKQDKWFDAWQVAMGWFIAHFCTLYAQSIANPGSPAATIIQTGQTKGLDTSISAGGVSASTDYNIIAQDLDGWASWKSTIYGTQLASMAKLIGMGGCYIY